MALDGIIGDIIIILTIIVIGTIHITDTTIIITTETTITETAETTLTTQAEEDQQLHIQTTAITLLQQEIIPQQEATLPVAELLYSQTREHITIPATPNQPLTEEVVLNIKTMTTNKAELIQEVKAIPLQDPTAVLHMAARAAVDLMVAAETAAAVAVVQDQPEEAEDKTAT